MQQHIRTIIKFLRSYGAVNIKANSAGSGNTRIDYVWKGEAKFSLVSSTPSDNRALSNIIADIRRLLGPPIQPELKMRSTLEELTAEAQRRADDGLPMPVAPDLEETTMETKNDLTPAAPPLQEFVGRAGHYNRNTLNIVLSVEAMAVFQHEGGNSISIQDNWIVIEASHTRHVCVLTAHSSSNGFVAEFPGNKTTEKWPVFGRTPVKMFVRKGHCEFKIDLETVAPLRQRHKQEQPPTIWKEPEIKQDAAVEHETGTITDNAYLRNIIIKINDVEARSPYKLKHINGAWTWAAYITADNA